MKILAIETTDTHGSLALGEYLGDAFNSQLDRSEGSSESNHSYLQVRATRDLPKTQRSAQSLVPSISELLKEMDWTPAELEAVIVGKGPGSFTGLRVGVTTAKILAWSIGSRIMGVETAMALAMNLPRFQEDRIVSFGIDAQRGEVAVQRFFLDSNPDEPPVPLDDMFSVLPVKNWLELKKYNDDSKKEECEKNTGIGIKSYPEVLYRKIIAALEEDTFFCGSVLNRWRDKVPKVIQNQMLDEVYCEPKASGILKAGFQKGKQSLWDDIWTLLPVYSRLSAAEERLKQKL